MKGRVFGAKPGAIVPSWRGARVIVMGDGWLMELLGNRWFLAITAYGLGFATAWFLIKSGRLDALKGLLRSSEEGEKSKSDTGTESDKLAALAAEITKAKTMLEENEADQKANFDLLQDLDEAVKRANGRLKLILKSINRQ